MISNKMLTCSAYLYKRTGIDEDRNPAYGNATELTKVYIVASYAQNNGAKGKQPGDSMTLFYDCFNSLPKGLTFLKGDKIVYNGTEFIINSISPYYSNGLQHYEIGLN